MPMCATQRERCDEAWSTWFGIDGAGASSVKSMVTFSALFCLGLCRQIVGREVNFASAGNSALAVRPVDGTPLAPRSPHVLPSATSPTWASEYYQGEAFMIGSSSTWHKASMAFLWLSLIVIVSCAGTQTTAIGVGYLLLLVMHVLAVESAPALLDPLAPQLRWLRSIRKFNMLTAIAWVAFQCPLAPCPYQLIVRPDESGEDPWVTLFVSPAQCIALGQDGGREYNTTPTWSFFVSVLLQLIGLYKVQSASFCHPLTCFTLVVFCASTLEAVLCARWHNELSDELRRDGEKLSRLGRRYVQHLALWRRLELSRLEMKRNVLHVKLDDLIGNLNNLRAIWVGRRAAIDEEESARREREHDRAVRVMDLALRSGVAPARVEGELEHFEAVARLPEVAKSGGAAPLTAPMFAANHQWDESGHRIVDDCVIERFRHEDLRILHCISAKEEEELRASLLRRCRSLLVVAGGPCMQHAPTPAVTGDPGEIVAFAAGDSREAGMWRIWAKFERLLRTVCEATIDDLLFAHDGLGGGAHETLSAHRKGASLASLICKAFWSQTFVLLLIAAALQFIAYMCVASMITVCAVIWSIMIFPVAPSTFWQTLQVYNLLMLLAKLMYQTPIFCWDGTVSFGGCAPEGEGASGLVPWGAIFGFMKVVPDRSSRAYLAFSSMAQAIWPDIFVCATLLLHCRMLRHSGRMHSTTADICRGLDTCEDNDGAASDLPCPQITGMATPSSALLHILPHQQHGRQQRDFSDLAGGASMLPTGATREESEDTQEQHEYPERHIQLQTWRCPGQVLNRFISRFQGALEDTRDSVLLNLNMRKPINDFYAMRFVLALFCWLILLVGWNGITGSGRSFAASLSANIFNGGQVIAVVSLLAILVLDRALYTWQTTSCSVVIRSADAPIVTPTQDVVDGVSPHTHRSLARSATSQATGRGAMGSLLQIGLLSSQLVVLHALCINLWSGGLTSSISISMWERRTLLLFYICALSYFALSSAQLKFDVAPIRGGLRLTHNTDLLAILTFKIYDAVPFLHELRVLIDWTVTATSLNFFMWMKLEDAHHSLYKTTCDMKGRRELSPAQRRPLYEKALQGCLLLSALFLLIVGPIIYFSTFSMFLSPNPIISGSLHVTLSVQHPSGGKSFLELYRSDQAHVHDCLGRQAATKFAVQYPDHISNPDGFTVQDVQFPVDADSFWLVSTSLRSQVAQQMQDSASLSSLSFRYEFDGNASARAAIGSVVVPLDIQQSATFAQVLNASAPTTGITVQLVGAVAPDLIWESGGVLYSLGRPRTLEMSITSSTGTAFPQWQLAAPCALVEMAAPDFAQRRPHSPTIAPPLATQVATSRAQASCQAKAGRCSVSFRVASEKVTPNAGTVSSASSVGSLVGVYITVVYAIGKFLRMVFLDSSKKIPYDELEDTAMLLDMCNGIYLARRAGDLDKEYELYYELIRIYRSPELLVQVSRPRGGRPSLGASQALPAPLLTCPAQRTSGSACDANLSMLPSISTEGL